MEKVVEKNKEYIVKVIDHGMDGEGIAKIDNFTIFIPGAIKGEKLKILIVKVLTSHAFAKILEIIEPSKHRIYSQCKTYSRCGGCNLRHIDYEETLNIKQNKVQSLVNKMLTQKITVEKTIGMGNPYHYRNKAIYPVGINKKEEKVIGVYAKRTHEIIPVKQCFIQNPELEEIAKTIFEFIQEENISVYNEKTGKGLVRHLVLKIGTQTNEIMCIIVINGNEMPKEKELKTKLIEQFPNIKTIVKNINKKNSNVILGNKNEIIYGDGMIEDKLGDFYFKISPLSFYQVNPVQTEILYHLGIEKAGLTKNDVVFDLYCGIGTISIFLANYVKEVYGIEIVEEAIDMANENAKRNNINNTKFFAGDVEEILDKLIEKEKTIPTVVFVDPPRKGLDEKTIQNLLKIEAEKIVYISCNPATLMRDLSKLEEKYEIKNIQPVDMFPFTSHVECCSVLYLKDSIQ